MLTHLTVRDLATLAQVDVEFPGGLVVLTGETGAGKSLLVESLRFALGGRTRGTLVREGAERAEVQAMFRVPKQHALLAELEKSELTDGGDPEQLLLRRVVRTGGRSSFQVNGTTVPTSTLAPLLPLLVDLTSQHEHVRLLDPAAHRELLDALPSVASKLEKYRAAFAAWRTAEATLAELERRVKERAERLDYLKFLLDECDRLDPAPNEEPKLEADWQRLAHAEEIRTTAAGLFAALTDGEPSVDSMLSAANGLLRTLTRLDAERGAEFAERVNALQTQLHDVANDIQSYGESIDADSQRRAEMETRLEDLKRLRKRLGCSAEELVDRIETLRGERKQLDTIETQSGSAQAEAAKARDLVRAAGEALEAARKAAAPEFVAGIQEHLKRLAMPHAKLNFVHEPRAEPGPDGLSELRLHVETNPGEGFHSLETVASGGELSRLLLAVKLAARGGDPVLCTVFDEVDSGIGGAAAVSVGALLKELARGRQVLCISHLPQVAAAADTHLHVSKDVQDGRTYTKIRTVKGRERLEVLSQMLGGEATNKGLAHAEELIRRIEAEAS